MDPITQMPVIVKDAELKGACVSAGLHLSDPETTQRYEGNLCIMINRL